MSLPQVITSIGTSKFFEVLLFCSWLAWLELDIVQCMLPPKRIFPVMLLSLHHPQHRQSDPASSPTRRLQFQPAKAIREGKKIKKRIAGVTIPGPSSSAEGTNPALAVTKCTNAKCRRAHAGLSPSRNQEREKDQAKKSQRKGKLLSQKAFSRWPFELVDTVP